MKNWFGKIGVAIMMCAGAAFGVQTKSVELSDFLLDVKVDDNRFEGRLWFLVDGLAPETPLPLIDSHAVLLGRTLPRGVKLVPPSDASGGMYTLVAEKSFWGGARSGRVNIGFTAAVQRDETGAQFVALRLPVAPIRKFSIQHSPEKFDVSVPGASETETQDSARSGILPMSPALRIEWRPTIARLKHTESVAACETATFATVEPGRIVSRAVLDYAITHGEMRELKIGIPENVNILRVASASHEVQTWSAENATLQVVLSNAARGRVSVFVEYEQTLAQFPCKTEIAPVVPRDVIRAHGFLAVGTASAIRIQPKPATNLLQTEINAFPFTELAKYERHFAAAKSYSVYEYSTTPSVLALTLEDIVTVIHADNTIVARVEDDSVRVSVNLRLDLRDAPARGVALTIENHNAWTVTSVAGRGVADADVEQTATENALNIFVPFTTPMSGSAEIQLEMERKHGAEQRNIALPFISVDNAEIQRGHIVAAASQGIRLATDSATHLTEVHAASTPVNIAGAQLAFRFREDAWRLALSYERAKSAIHSEVFHLVSPGDGILYASAAVTFHISGAPTDTFRFKVPEAIRTVDVTSADIDRWSRSGDVLTVKLNRRIIGDRTILLSYEQIVDYHVAEFEVGGIETIGTESEPGFIVLAGPAHLKAEEARALPESMIRIAAAELPSGYAATLLAPVTAAWKYMRAPHAASLRLTTLDTERMIGQVVDFLSIESKVARNGEVITRAKYFVKNASGQYITLRLPENSRLWAVNKLSENGIATEAPSQFDGGNLLVPIERPRDPNAAAIIEITYATDNSATPKKQTLCAPLVIGAPVTFAEWTLAAGDKFALVRARGNMSPDEKNKLRFTRTSVMPDDAPLALSFAVRPLWLGDTNLAVLGALGALCFAGLVLAVFARRRFGIALAVSCALGIATLFGASEALVCVAVVCLGALLIGAGIIRMCYKGVKACVRKRAANELPPFEATAPDSATRTPFEESEEEEMNETDESGFARIGLVAVVAVCALPILLMAQTAATQWRGAFSGDNAEYVVITTEDILVEAVRQDEDDTHVAIRYSYEYDCDIKTPGTFVIGGIERYLGMYSDTALSRMTLPKNLSLMYKFVFLAENGDPRYSDVPVEKSTPVLMLVAKKPGTYKFGFTESGKHKLSGTVMFSAAGSLKTAVKISWPDTGMKTTANLAALDIAESDGTTTITGFLPIGAGSAIVEFAPQARDRSTETPVIYADTETYAELRAGVVEMISRVGFRVVQGEMRDAQIRVPEPLQVIDLAGADIASWNFDSGTRTLTMVFAKPRTANFAVTVKTSIAAEAFPYTTQIRVPSVVGVDRARGTVGVNAAESVLLRVAKTDGCSRINAADFWKRAESGTVRHAFRYDDAAQTKIDVAADAVKPDVRSTFNAALSISDERNTLSARLNVSVAKAGIFSVNLDIPADYGIESVSGADVNHWDDRRKSGGGTEVTFKKNLIGNTTLNIVLTKQQKGIDARFDVPRIGVAGATKQTGTVTISPERGVKIVLDAHDGVAQSRADFGRGFAKDTLVLDLLRADWRAAIKTEVMEPVLKPDVLHHIAIAEGMIRHNVHMRCKIENAGVKQFRVVVPAADASLTVSGKHIARVAPEGDAREDGSRVWTIELQGKAENEYAATLLYQEQYLPGAPVRVKPLTVAGAARQTGWLVVTGDSRIRVDAQAVAAELRAEDARAVPNTFGAEDLAGALHCWKVLNTDASVELSVTRHAAADVLPAHVESVKQRSVLSVGGRTLTQTDVRLAVGKLRFLRIALPDAAAELWTAHVNGTPVTVSTESDGVLGIPLDSVLAGDSATVSFVWSSTVAIPGRVAESAEKINGSLTLDAPRFPDLPLNNIEWRVFVPNGFSYTMTNKEFDRVENAPAHIDGWFDSSGYVSYNRKRSKVALETAASNFNEVGKMLDSGDRARAQMALKQAINLSQADVSLNEDARIQFENVAVQNTKIGFLNRRGALRFRNNIFDETQPQQAFTEFNEGNFDNRFVEAVESRLGDHDRAGLDLVSAKLVAQQAATEAAAPAIAIAMPEQGNELVFTRVLQTQLGGAMHLALSVTPDTAPAHSINLSSLLPALLALPAVWLLSVFAFGARKRTA